MSQNAFKQYVAVSAEEFQAFVDSVMQGGLGLLPAYGESPGIVVHVEGPRLPQMRPASGAQSEALKAAMQPTVIVETADVSDTPPKEAAPVEEPAPVEEKPTRRPRRTKKQMEEARAAEATENEATDEDEDEAPTSVEKPKDGELSDEELEGKSLAEVRDLLQAASISANRPYMDRLRVALKAKVQTG